jgi:tetratricopeptide (TPR) repeat protein
VRSRSRGRRSAWAAALSLCCWVRAAEAEPTLWERAKDPGASLRARARLRAEQLFDQASDARSDPQLLQQLSAGSAALLELSGGRRDPFQAVLLGRVLLDARPGREAEAVRLIESGLALLPDSDFKRASLFDVGLGSMLSGDMEHAVRAFTSALALAWDPDYRASIHRNRGKAQMLAGHLSESVNDFRAAVALARGVEVLALSHFGLGVALERSGDYPQGMQEIARGVAVRLPVPPYPSDSVLDLPSLRWIPEHDVHYFRGLGEMTEASDPAVDADAQREHYALALESWEQYLPAAQASRDRFVPNAQRHRRRCLEALERLTPRPVKSRRVR